MVGPVPGPRPQPAAAAIRQLDEATVCRIAAGEVVQRPVSALKELLENALDAGATHVAVLVKEGGVRLLQVQDNGGGIRGEDLPVLCHRHTTSKLREFEDLRSIATLGFRGEALASISYVAHVAVTTMPAGAPHALKATYKDGELKGAGPKPSAGVPGTTVTVEDMFYNVLARRKALKSANEEYSRIMDVVTKYAVFKQHVGFSCRRQGQGRPDINTTGGGDRLDTIRAVYGPAAANELLDFGVARGCDPGEDLAGCRDEGALRFRAAGHISSINYSSKKTTMILFINGRLVDAPPLRRALEAVYAAAVPKVMKKPFLYLELELPPFHVDVNVHPTKKEVQFLHQEALIDCVREAVEERILEADTARHFVQTTLPGSEFLRPGPSQPPADRDPGGADDAAAPGTQRPPATTQRDKAGGDHKLVRVDASNPAGRLEAFLHTGGGAAAEAGPEEGRKRGPGELGQLTQAQKRQRAPTPEACKLTSVEDILEDIERNTHAEMLEVFRQNTYVGVADEKRILLQYRTKLFLVNIHRVSKDLVYQQVFRKFGRFPTFTLSEPTSVREMLLFGLERLAEEAGEDGKEEEEEEDKESTANTLAELLQAKADMLGEYFGLKIDDAGRLLSLPQIVDRYVPDLAGLPKFLVALAHDTNWAEEAPCFMDVAAQLADFYAVRAIVPPGPEEGPPAGGYAFVPGPTGVPTAGSNPRAEAAKVREKAIQHVILPAARLFLQPQQSRATDGTVVQLTTLQRLYRTFERC